MNKTINKIKNRLFPIPKLWLDPETKIFHCAKCRRTCHPDNGNKLPNHQWKCNCGRISRFWQINEDEFVIKDQKIIKKPDWETRLDEVCDMSRTLNWKAYVSNKLIDEKEFLEKINNSETLYKSEKEYIEQLVKANKSFYEVIKE